MSTRQTQAAAVHSQKETKADVSVYPVPVHFKKGD